MKNLVALAPVLGAILRPDQESTTFSKQSLNRRFLLSGTFVISNKCDDHSVKSVRKWFQRLISFPNRRSLFNSTMEEETDGQATRRQVIPNVTLDQQGVRNENLLCLRRSRREAKGNVTKEIAEITMCMSQSPSAEEFYPRHKSLTRQ